MTIDPRIAFWFGVWTNILVLVAGYGFDHAPAAIAQYAPTAQWISGFLAQINSIILTAMMGLSSNKVGPLVSVPVLPPVTPTVVKILLVAFVLSAFLAIPSAHAQNRPPLTGNIARDIAAATGRPNPSSPGLTGNPLGDIIGALDVKLLPDLQYALKLATASGSKVTGPCYQAWIDIINVRQKAVQDDQTPPQALPMPDPHLVTDFEKLVELRNSLQPDSEFMIRCSPVASMVKKDIIGFIGTVISGGAGLATMVPGL